MPVFTDRAYNDDLVVGLATFDVIIGGTRHLDDHIEEFQMAIENTYGVEKAELDEEAKTIRVFFAPLWGGDNIEELRSRVLRECRRIIRTLVDEPGLASAKLEEDTTVINNA